MAFTATLVKQDVFGAVRVGIYDCTADALSGSVATSLGVIQAAHLGLQSCATGGIQMYPNKNAAGTATNGSIKISGCTSGDQFFLIVYGKS